MIEFKIIIILFILESSITLQKKGFQDFTELDILDGLPPCSFQWKSDRKRLGKEKKFREGQNYKF